MSGITSLELRAIAIVVLVVSSIAGYAWWSHELELRGAAQCKADQVTVDQAEEQRRVAAQKEVNDESQRMVAVAAAARDRLSRAAGVLRPQVAALIGRCDPTPASVGPAASSPADLLTDMSGRVGEAVAATVDYAASAARAGAECAARYDALTSPAKITLDRLVLGR